MEHLRVFEDRFVLERELLEKLPAGPLVDQEVGPGDQEQARDAEPSRQPLGSSLLGQDAHQAFQAGDTQLVRIPRP